MIDKQQTPLDSNLNNKIYLGFRQRASPQRIQLETEGIIRRYYHPQTEGIIRFPTSDEMSSSTFHL